MGKTKRGNVDSTSLGQETKTETFLFLLFTLATKAMIQTAIKLFSVEHRVWKRPCDYDTAMIRVKNSDLNVGRRPYRCLNEILVERRCCCVFGGTAKVDGVTGCSNYSKRLLRNRFMVLKSNTWLQCFLEIFNSSPKIWFTSTIFCGKSCVELALWLWYHNDKS